MAKNKPETTETGLDEINDSLTKVTNRVQENKKVLAVITVVVLAVCALVLAYVYFFRNPAMQRANDNIGAADLELIQGNDSVALAQYKKIADDGSYAAGNRAALNAAILIYQEGAAALADNKEADAKKKFEEALKYAEKYSADEDIIGAAALGLQGDCLVNLDRLDDAAGKFKKAVKVSDENPAYTPYFMIKLARIYDAQKKYADEVEILQEVKNDYPYYQQQHQVNVDAMLELAKLRAGK